MKYTPNLNLKKPESHEVVNIDDLNENADKLDQEVARRIINSGNVPSIQAGLDAEKPSPGTAGRLYIATDTKVIYRDIGSAWVKMSVVKWGDIDGKPSSFPPSAHKSTHASGGSDALTPADIGAASQADLEAHIHATNNPHQVTAHQIGAETPSGAQAKADAAEANAKKYADETKVSKTGDTITGILIMDGNNAINFGGKFQIAYNSATNSLDIRVVG